MKPIVLPDRLDNSDPLEYLCHADEQGFLLAPGETPESFAERVGKLVRNLPENLPEGLPEAAERVRADAEAVTEDLYGFRAAWLPVYYSTAETGRFSAGVSLFPDDSLPLVYLSGAFLKKPSHRGYTAGETLAHEAVHAARLAFPDNSAYDEYFPCQVHSSAFRRLAGNLFRHWYIPLIFFLGLVFAPLCLLTLLLPAAVLLVEFLLLQRIRTAKKKIRSLGLRPEPVLLRLSDAEIRTLAAGKLPSCLSDKTSLRFRLFFRRFSLK